MGKELDKAREEFKKAKWKTASDYEEEAKAKPTKGPLALTREEMEKVQLENEEKRNPEEYRKRKELYESSVKMQGMKKGGCVRMAKGGSASSRADGCAVKGRTKGRIV